jgi:uncharacterized membrane protein
MRGMLGGRKLLAFLIRLALFACVILALAGLQSYRQNRGVCTIFLLDHSDSIRSEDRDKEEQFLKDASAKLGSNDEAGVIVFGKEAAIESSPADHYHPSRILSVVDGTTTDISAAIRLASASFPEGKAKRIIVLSDGNETSGDAESASIVAGSEGIPIDAVALGGTTRPQVALESLEAPSESRSGEPFQVKISAHSNVATEGQLVLDRDGVVVKRMGVTLTKGENTFSIDESVNGPGFHRFRAILSTDADSDVRNKVSMGFVSVRGKAKVLLLQGPKDRSPLAQALEKQDITVEARGIGGVPTRAEEIQDFDAVILNDFNAQYMTPQQMKLLQSAVRDTGVGLAMIGGEDSFLPGGWYGTPVAEALPVDLEIHKRESFPSLSVLIICDTSGSMGMIEDGVQKVKLAAKAAAMTIDMLPSYARAGVVASTDGIEFVAPMQQLSDKKAMEAEAMRMSVGGGGIYAKPSMDFAIEHLEAENTKVRHLILMADGSDVDLRDGCYEIAEKMRSEHITTSAVAIGDGQYVPFLKGLAAVGGGRFYLALHGNQLPAVFTQDAAVMARSAIEEGAFLPKVSLGEDLVRGLDVDSMPPLFGYDLTDTKPISHVGMRTQKDDPLLATWQYGLGTSLAFTSDAQPRWAAKWMAWPGYGVFWAHAVRELTRQASSNTFRIQTSLEGAKGEVRVKAVDPAGEPLPSAPSTIRVSRPDGSFQDVALSQVAPGIYSGSFDASEIGSYIATIAEKDGSGRPRITSSGFSNPYPAEYRRFETNAVLLSSIAENSGGRANIAASTAFSGVAKPGYSIQDLWPILLIISCFLLPVDIAVRRIALPFGEILIKARAWVLRRRNQRTPSGVPEKIGRLHRAKQRAGVSPTPSPVPEPVVLAPTYQPLKEERKIPAGEPGSASNRLLDAKRKRRGS